MIRIFKYLGVFIIVIIIISVIGILLRGSRINENNDGQSKGQKQTEESKQQYRMYFKFEGNKSQLIDLIKEDVNLKLVYSGETKFTAKILNADGTLLTVLVDEIGPYNGIQVVKVPETGAYILDVKTSGEWSLSRN
jgi:hypothetical protein